MDIARAPGRRIRLPKAALAVGLAIALVATALTLFRSSRASANTGPIIDRKTVWTDRVKRGELLRQAPAQGTLIPEHVQWLSATSAGLVAKIPVRPGAQVEPDDVVVVLTNPDLEIAALDAEKQAASAEAALIQLDVRTEVDAKLARGGLTTLRADLADANRHATMAERMLPEGLMSTTDRDDAVSKAKALTLRIDDERARLDVLDTGRGRQLASGRAEVERLHDMAAFARRRLASLEVHAGIKGVVQDIPLENGQWVALGTVLAKVAEPSRLKAEVRVAEADAKDIHRGLPMRFEAPSAFAGHVDRVDPAVAKGSVRIEVTIDGDLPPGARVDQTVSGYIEIDRLHQVLFVTRPTGATDESATTVFKVQGKGASRTTVRFGRGSAREIEIASGLSEGDEIITSDVPSSEGATSLRFE